MQDFETIEVDTKLSKAKYLLLEIQDHLELFKDERVKWVLEEVLEKADMFFFHGGKKFSLSGREYRLEFIALSESVGIPFDQLYVGVHGDNLSETFPHNYFDFHLEQLNRHLS